MNVINALNRSGKEVIFISKEDAHLRYVLDQTNHEERVDRHCSRRNDHLSGSKCY